MLGCSLQFGERCDRLAAFVGLRMIDPAKVRPAPVTPRGRGQVRAGLSYAWSIAELRVPLIMMAIIGTLAFNFQTVLPLFATRDLGGQEITFSLLMSVVSVGSLVGALRSARRTNVSVHTVSLSAAGFGASMLALALAPNQPVAFAVGVVMGFTSISFMTASTAIVQLRADPMMRGRILALQAMVFLGSTPVGGPILGVICERYGARYGLAVGAVATIGAAAYGLLVVRRDRAIAVGEGPVAVRPATTIVIAPHQAPRRDSSMRTFCSLAPPLAPSVWAKVLTRSSSSIQRMCPSRSWVARER